ncbi:MAG: hypothetical protein M3Z09_12570 [Acidobacteriota bacterium]|nr:hypothetical protein [Acidobacteriota bacterium]
MTVTGPNGASVSIPGPAASSGAYAQSAAPGFLGAGNYIVSAGGSSTIGAFQVSVTLDNPIQVSAPAHIPSGSPLAVRWTGGSPANVVKITLVSGDESNYIYTSADTGSYTFQPFCAGNSVAGVTCSYLGVVGVARIVVEQMPVTIGSRRYWILELPVRFRHPGIPLCVRS